MRTLHISKETSTSLKGLACLLIVAHHFCSWLMGKGYGNWFFDFIGVRGGVVGVTVFFFLSAYGLSESQINNHYSFSAFLKRRLSKVFIPLAITNIIFFIFLLIRKSIDFNLSSFILNTLNIHYLDGVLWFCNTILIFYLIFYLSFLPKMKWSKVSVCLLFTLIYSVSSTIFFPDAPFYVYSIIGFPFGMICSLYKDDIFKFSNWGYWSILLLLILLLGSIVLPTYKKLLLMNSYCFILLILLVELIQYVNIPKNMVILSYIGTYSYEIYLLHNKVLVPIGQSGYILWYPVAFLFIVIPLAILLNRLMRVTI